MVHDDESDDVSGEADKIPIPLQASLPPSKLPLLLLHVNDQNQSQAYISQLVHDSKNDLDSFESGSGPRLNPFYSANVNVRKFVDPAKFLYCETDADKRENLAWQTCKSGGDTYSCPITGNFTTVFASFDIVRDGEKASPPLFPTYQTHTDEPVSPSSKQGTLRGRIQAIPPTSAILLKGVQFLRGTKPGESSHFEEEVKLLDENVDFSFNDSDKLRMQLSTIYLAEMSKLKPPNTDTAELEKFIKDRDWSSDCVWGGNQVEFLKEIAVIKDDSTKWTVLRDYIYYNMAWVTKLLLLPVDSLHRTAAADSALRGIPPPEADIVLQTHVRKFGKTLTHLNGMLATNDGSKKIVIEGLISLMCIVPTTMDTAFLSDMRNLSAQAQEKGNHSSFHSLIHMVGEILPAVSAELKDNYLMESLDYTHGLNRILRGLPPESRKESFKKILVSDDLCESDEEAERVANELETDTENKNWKTNPTLSDSNLCEVYIILWIKKFSKVLHKTLKHYIKCHPNIILIDEEVEVKVVEAMCEEVFARIFQAESNKTESATSVLPRKSGMQLDIFHETIKKPILFHNFGGKLNVGKRTTTWDPLNGEHLRITNRIDGSTNKYFPHRLLDLVWLLMLSNLSKSCNDAILKYLSGTANTSRFPQRCADQSGKVKGRRSVRCLLLIVSYLSTVIKTFHSKSVFVGEKNRQWIKAIKLHRLKGRMQDCLALISAVENTCPLFEELGQNPAQPEWAKTPPPEVLTMMTEKNWSIADHILHDYMCLLTVTFCMHLYRMTKNILDLPDDESKAKMAEIVCYSLALYCNKEPDIDADFGVWTDEGVEDLQVTPNLAVVTDFPHGVEHHLSTIVQAVRKNDKFDGTQMIDEFVRAFFKDNAWTIIHEELKSALSSADSEPPLAGNPTQSGGEVAATTATTTAITTTAPPIVIETPIVTETPTAPLTAPPTAHQALPTTTEPATKITTPTKTERKKRKRKPTDLYSEAPKEWKDGVLPMCLTICDAHKKTLDKVPDDDEQLRTYFTKLVSVDELNEIALKSLVLTARKVKEDVLKEAKRKTKALVDLVELQRNQDFDADYSSNEALGSGNEGGESDKEKVESYIDDEAVDGGSVNDDDEENDSRNSNEVDKDAMFTSDDEQSTSFNHHWNADEQPSDEESPSDEVPRKKISITIHGPKKRAKSSDERPSSRSSSVSSPPMILPLIPPQKNGKKLMNGSNNHVADTDEGDGETGVSETEIYDPIIESNNHVADTEGDGEADVERDILPLDQLFDLVHRSSEEDYPLEDYLGGDLGGESNINWDELLPGSSPGNDFPGDGHLV